MPDKAIKMAISIRTGDLASFFVMVWFKSESRWPGIPSQVKPLNETAA